MTDSAERAGDLVERVARALAEEFRNQPVTRVNNPDLEGSMFHMARAAIAAMREPTEAMVKAGTGVTWWDGKDDDEWEENVSPHVAKDIYQAMIDEALK